MVETPLGDQGVDTREGAGEECIGFRIPCRLDGGEDPAAGPGDVLVAHPLESHLELARAIAPVHDVRVAVDQSRGDQTTFQVAPRPGRAGVGHRVPRSAPGDPSAVQRHRALGDKAIGPAARLHGGQGQIGEELPGHWLVSLLGRRRARRVELPSIHPGSLETMQPSTEGG